MDELIKKINILENENKILSNKLNSLEHEHNLILKSYNDLFNNIYVYHELTRKPLIKNYVNIILEILDFIDNVCKKYEIEWWLSAGNLLGSIRHGGFIPWDDDCDINFMRKDYEKFLDVINYELKENGLNEYMIVKNCASINNFLTTFTKIDYWVDGKLLAFIDIFPFDYINQISDTFEEDVEKEYNRICNELKKGNGRRDILKTTFETFGITLHKSKYIVTGIEHAVELKIHDTEKIFPLSEIKFENRNYPCPNDLTYYMKIWYGEDYMKVPKVIKTHNFHYRLLKTDNINILLEEHTKKLNKINASFK